MHNILVTYLLWVAGHNVFHCLEITQLWVTSGKPCSKLDFPNEPGLSLLIWKVRRNHKTCFTAWSVSAVPRLPGMGGKSRSRRAPGWGCSWDPQSGRDDYTAKGKRAGTEPSFQSYHHHFHLLLSSSTFPDWNPCHWFQGSQTPTDFQKALTLSPTYLPPCLCSAPQCNTLSSRHQQRAGGFGIQSWVSRVLCTLVLQPKDHHRGLMLIKVCTAFFTMLLILGDTCSKNLATNYPVHVLSVENISIGTNPWLQISHLHLRYQDSEARK